MLAQSQRYELGRRFRTFEELRAKKPGEETRIESARVSGKRQLTLSRRARASALRRNLKIFRASRALGLVATSFSHFHMNIRASAFGVCRAAWRYVAYWTVNRATRRDDDACAVSA